MAAREDWWADGYLLTDGVVRNIEYRKGIGYSPPKVGTNIRLPGSDGVEWVPKSYEAGTFLLNMWLSGDTQAEVWAGYERLLLAVSKKHRLTRFQRNMPDGSSRECWGEVAQAIEPEWLTQNTMRVGIEVTIPGAFWQDPGEQIALAYLVGLPNLAVDIGQLSGATAPMADLLYTIQGPLSDLFVIDTLSWEWFFYQGSIGVGEQLIVDGSWALVTTPGGVTNLGRFFYTGWRFLDLMPAEPPQVPQITVQCTAPGAGSFIQVEGKRKYLV